MKLKNWVIYMKRLIKKRKILAETNTDMSKLTKEQVDNFIPKINNLTQILQSCIRDYITNLNELQIKLLISFSIADRWPDDDINDLKEYITANDNAFETMIAMDPNFWDLLKTKLNVDISDIDCEFTNAIITIIMDENNFNTYQTVIFLTLERVINNYNNIDNIIKQVHQVFINNLNEDSDEEQIDDVARIFSDTYFNSLENAPTNDDTNDNNNINNEDNNPEKIIEDLNDASDGNELENIDINEIKEWDIKQLQQSNTTIDINQIINDKLSNNISVLTLDKKIYGVLGTQLLSDITFENENIDECINNCKTEFINNYNISQILQARQETLELYNQNDPLINIVFHEYFDIDLPLYCPLYESLYMYIDNYLHTNSNNLNINNIKALILINFDELKNNNIFKDEYQKAIKDYDDRLDQEINQPEEAETLNIDINNFSLQQLIAQFPKFSIYLNNLFKNIMSMCPYPVRTDIIKNICEHVLNIMNKNKQITKDSTAEQFFYNFQNTYYQLAITDIYNIINNIITKQYINIARTILYNYPQFKDITLKQNCNIANDIANYITANIKQRFIDNANSNINNIIDNILNTNMNKSESPFKQALNKFDIIKNNKQLKDSLNYQDDFRINNPSPNISQEKIIEDTSSDESANKNIKVDLQNISNWTIQELFIYAKLKNVNIDNIIQQQYNNIKVFLSSDNTNNELKEFIRYLQYYCCKKLIENNTSCKSPDELSDKIKQVLATIKYNSYMSIRQQIIQKFTKSDQRENLIPDTIFKELQISNIAYNAPIMNAIIQYISQNSNKFTFENLLQTRIYDMIANTDIAADKVNVIFLRYFPQLFPDKCQMVNTIERLSQVAGISREQLDNIIQQYCNQTEYFIPDNLKADFEKILLNKLITLNNNKNIRKTGSAIWNDLIQKLLAIKNHQSTDYNTILINCRSQILKSDNLQIDPLLRAIMNHLVHNFPYDQDIKNDKSPVKLLYNYIFPDQTSKRRFTFDVVATNIFNYLSIDITDPDAINNNEIFWTIINAKIKDETDKQHTRDKNSGKENTKTFFVHPDTPEKFRRQRISNSDNEINTEDYDQLFNNNPPEKTNNPPQESLNEDTSSDKNPSIDENVKKIVINQFTINEFDEFLQGKLHDIIVQIASNNIYSFLPKELLIIFIQSLSQNISVSKQFVNNTFSSKEELLEAIKEQLSKISYKDCIKKRDIILSPKYNTTTIKNPLYHSTLETFNLPPYNFQILSKSKLATELYDYIKQNTWNFKENIHNNIFPLLLQRNENTRLQKFFDQFNVSILSQDNPENEKQIDKDKSKELSNDDQFNDDKSEQKAIIKNDKQSKSKREKRGRISIENWTVQQLINNINYHKFINKEILQNEIAKAAIGCIESNQGYEKGYEFIFKPLFEGELKNADENLRKRILDRVELHNLILNNINKFRMMCHILAFNLSDHNHIYLINDINKNNKLITFIRQELITPKIINQLKNRLFYIYDKYKQSLNYNDYIQSFPSINDATNINDNKGDVQRYQKDTSAAKEKIIIINDNIYTGNINESYQDILYKLPIDNQLKNLNNCAYGFITNNNCIFLHPLNNYLEEDIIQAIHKSNLNIKKVYLTINNNKDFVTERRLAKCFKIKRYKN